MAMLPSSLPRVTDLVLNSSYLRNSYRKRRGKEVRSGALTLLPPRFGVPFIFCVVGVMMLFKQVTQQSMYRATMHQAVGLLSVVTGFLRFFSYRYPHLTMPTAGTPLCCTLSPGCGSAVLQPELVNPV
jgi:hypothetical protein